jgi:hypothetical protein
LKPERLRLEPLHQRRLVAVDRQLQHRLVLGQQRSLEAQQGGDAAHATGPAALGHVNGLMVQHLGEFLAAPQRNVGPNAHQTLAG